MRSRGAKVADLAILVVAADDGVMPQTKQSLEFIREAKTPFLVAITKIDLPTVQIDKVKGQLLELEVVSEDYGGETVVVQVSSKTGQGIEDLLEMITLLAEMNGISGDPKAGLEAYVIETMRDPRRGVVASAVLKNGTIKIGDFLSSDGVDGKARGLFDSQGKPVREAYAGDPVEIIGLSALPAVGAKITHKGQESVEVKEEMRKIPKTEGFPVILKADSAGSLEAILGQLNREVGVLYSGVGEIIESDVLTASPHGAVVVGFNVKAGRDVLKLAEEEKVKVYTYKIIYELAQDIEKWRKEKEESLKEKILGRAEVIAQFPHGKERIAGCKLLEGRFTKSDKVRLVRDEITLGNVRMASLKKQKQEVDKVAEIGEEFGVYFEPQFDFKLGDMLESYL
jgi:translation initiation factor IF-2